METPINMVPLKNQGKVVSAPAHDLINMNHTMSLLCTPSSKIGKKWAPLDFTFPLCVHGS